MVTTERPILVHLPAVQLIGAQKSGTSSIADWLFEGAFQRPQVIGTEPWYYSKEVHFFDLDHRYCKGVEFYSERFRSSNARDHSKSKLTMDATPDTLQFPERVRSTYEQAGGGQVERLKIIVVLRDPIARELSLYNHLVHDFHNLKPSERTSWNYQVARSDGTVMSFDEFVDTVSLPALRSDNNGYGRSTRHGLYAQHLRRWFDCFDRKQILVLSFNELQHHPRRLQQRIQSFLGVRIHGDIVRSNSNDHKDKVKNPSKKSKAALQSVFLNQNADLYELLDQNPGPLVEETPFPRFEGTS